MLQTNSLLLTSLAPIFLRFSQDGKGPSLLTCWQYLNIPRVPPNVQFEIDDAESEWTFRDNSFDLIHWRLLIAGIADYPLLFGQAFRYARISCQLSGSAHCSCLRATKPGGYCEIQELDPHFYSDDGSLHPDSSIVKWGNLVCEGSAKNGRPVPRLDQYKTWMEEAGFVDVKETYFKRASNSWPKDPHMKEIGKVD